MIRDILAAIQNLFTWVVLVSPWEQALRIRLGKHVRLLHAGVFLRIPFFDRVYRQSIRRRLHVIPAQNLTSLDGKTITLGASVGYTIVDLMKLYNTLHNATDTIESEVSSIVAEYISTHNFAECNPARIEEYTRPRINLQKYGLGEAEFYIINFVAAKAYRIIGGDVRCYSTTNLDTSQYDSPRGGSGPPS